jgi:thymidylate synthase
VNVINEKVNLHCTMRSTDAPVGLPTNIASYALLLKCFSSWLGKEPGELAITCVDIHVYSDQYQLVSEQLKRGPMFLCQVSIDTDPEKLQLLRADRINYQSWPTIDYPVAL